MHIEISITCTACGKEIYHATAADEAAGKAEFAKAWTASELHDCQATPKKAKP